MGHRKEGGKYFSFETIFPLKQLAGVRNMLSWKGQMGGGHPQWVRPAQGTPQPQPPSLPRVMGSIQGGIWMPKLMS